MKFYEDNQRTLYNGDCRQMVEVEDESIQAATTSPPYWGLRKYEGSQDLIWGGDKGCQHEWGSTAKTNRHSHTWATSSPEENRPPTEYIEVEKGQYCQLCGAWKGQFGLEPTPELYVQHTVEILREIRRVLRKDGVVFWNIGDSYAGGKGTCFNPGGGKGSFSTHGDRKDAGVYPLDRGNVSMLKTQGLKPKDLCLIPFHIAIAAQQDGWWVRSVIIWNKPNPMPESVADRPANTYEFILMLTKSGTTQYWTHRDHEGTRKQPKPDYRWIKQVSNIRGLKTKGLQEVSDPEQNHGLDIAPQIIVEEVAIKPDGWTRENKMGWDRMNLWEGHDYYWDADAVREIYTEPLNRWGGDSLKRDTSKTAAYKEMQNIGHSSAFRVGKPIRPNENGRNLRDVWTFPTTPFPSQFVNGEKLDHFAVFPEKLPELCIKAATSEKGCCPKCGAPWVRVIDKKPSQFNIRVRDAWAGRATPEEGYKATEEEIAGYPGNHPDMGYRQTLGWKPTCDCGLDPIPCTVLDPFMGSGTTLLVATKLGRKSIGYDISESYCKMAVNRNRQGAL